MRPRPTAVLLVLAALAAAPAAAQAATPPAFSAPSSFPATDGIGSSARAVALGDLGGDGHLDAVVAQKDAPAIVVLHGGGDGTFGPPSSVPIGGSVQRVAIADLDRDGRRDVVVADAGGVVVVRNTPAGLVPGPEVQTPWSSLETGLAVADVTGDGNPDVVRSSTEYSGSVTVLSGDGAGGLSLLQSVPTRSMPEGLTLADVDRDGDLDVVVGTVPPFEPASVDVLRNAGDGTLRSFDGPMTSAGWPATLLSADVDGDGHDDVVLGDRAFGIASVLPNNGTPFLAVGAQPSFGIESAASAAAGDLDGDGVVDLVGAGGAEVGVLMGHGDGTFDAPLHPVAGVTGARWAALGDLDENGTPDLVVVQPDGLLVFRNTRDSDPPVVTVSAPPAPSGQGGFFGADDLPVTVAVSATDPSGVRALRCTVDGADVPVGGQAGLATRTGAVAVTGDGAHAVVCEATDAVGNAGAFDGSTPTATVSVDATAPVVTCDVPADAGSATWHAAEQSVACAAADAGGSGLRDGADASFALSTAVGAGHEDPAAPTDARAVCDRAGNCAPVAGPYAFAVDRRGPAVTCGPTPAFLLRQSPAAVGASVADAGSGAAAPSASAAADTSVVGARTAPVTGADAVGNATTVRCAYAVAYGFAGFDKPLESLPAANVMKAGQTATAKWSLVDAGGAAVTAVDPAAVRVTTRAQSCAGGDLPGAVDLAAAGAGALQESRGGRYQIAWRTPASLAGTCALLRIDLGEGSAAAPLTHDLLFRFKP